MSRPNVCRFYNTSTETIDQLISGCIIFPPDEYRNTQSRVGQYIHWKICNNYDTVTPSKWCEHKPLAVVDTPIVTILWDFPIRTDRTIQAKRENRIC